MKLTEILEVVQVHRHDFLNHLQVISGLLQLNKVDKVNDYINQVSRDMGRLSVITRMQMPELKAVLLVAVNNAHKHQVDFIFDIDTDMEENCNCPGEILALAVEECINAALKELSPPQVADRRLLFSLSENGKKYVFKFRFPGLSAAAVSNMQTNLEYCRSLKEQGVQVGLAVTVERAEVFLTVPK